MEHIIVVVNILLVLVIQERQVIVELQKLKFHSDVLGRDFSLRISASGLRTLTKHGGLDGYVIAKPVSRLTEDMAAIKRAIEKKVGKAAAPEKKPAYKANRSARLIKKVESKQVSA